MFKTILVPLDGSPLAEQAVGTAAALARATRGEIALVLARPSAPAGDSPAEIASEPGTPEARAYLQRIANEIAQGAGITASEMVATGAPVDVICRRAREIGADVIVMTSHARTGLSRAWLGSVADGVVRKANAPVLLLRAAPEGSAMGHGHAAPLFERILVPLDDATPSAAVLEAAASIARCSAATVILVRVVVPVPMYWIDPLCPAYVMNSDPNATQRATEAAKADLDDLATHFAREHRITVETTVEVADSAAAGILDVAKARGADLIAMTTHSRGSSRLVLGSVTDKVLRGGHLPVLLNHPEVRTAAATAYGAIHRMLPDSEAELTP